jgi:multidrug transporter EmrE-like cation transporter
MTSTLHAMLIVAGVSIFEAIGLTALRFKKIYSIPIASGIYALVVIPLLYTALKFQGIGMVNFISNIFSTIMLFLIGIYIFDEPLHNLQIVGVLVSLLGLFLILLAPDK